MYEHLIQKKPERIAFVDIDYTLSNHPSDTSHPALLNFTLANKARQMLKKRGFLVTLTTSRTEEMLMSSKEYEISVTKYGLKRPPPKLKEHMGTYTYIPPEKMEPEGILDPDIIVSSTGAKIFVRQPQGGYLEDVQYHSQLPPANDWRKNTMDTLSHINHELHLFSFSFIEDENNFLTGKTDVYPPDYRIQISFINEANLIYFRNYLRIRYPDLFLFNESTPGKNKYSLYICPVNGKAAASVRILEQLRLPLSSEILIVGDSYTDLHEALNIPSYEITLLLVGGSRLSSFFIDPQAQSFAGEDLSEIKKSLKKIEPGIYRYEGQRTRTTCIVSDEKNPGLVGPESLIEYLT